MSQPRHRSLFAVVARLVLVTLVPAVAAAGELHTPAAATRLDDVVVTTKPDITTIHLKTSGRPKYQADFIDTPPRVVVDLEETAFAWRPGRHDLAGTLVRQIRGSQFRKGVARVVVELTGPMSYAVRQNADGIAIVLGTPREAPAVMTLATAPVEDRTSETRGPIVIAQAPRPTTPPARPSAPPPPPPAIAPAPGPPGTRLISLDFKDADVVNLLRILAAESGKNVVIADDVKGKMSITLKNVPWEQALEIIMEARGLEKVERGNVIRIITREALQREREAQAKIEEARVKAEEAKARADSEIRAKAAESAVKEQEAQARKFALEQQLEEVRARGPIREETIRLAYADPEDVAKTLIGILGITPGAALQTVTPLSSLPPGVSAISSVGTMPVQETRPAPPPPGISPEAAAKGITVQAHKPTNSIFIRHYEKDIERIKKLIRETLDVQLPQIKIESRIVTLSRTDLFEVGVQWGGAGARRSGQTILVGQGVTTAADLTRTTGLGIAPFTAPTAPGVQSAIGGGLGSLLPVAGATALPIGGNLVNLPTTGTPTGGINFGIVGTRFNLNLTLQALETKTSTRILAKPEIVVMDNQKASIVRGTEIGYQTGTATTGFSVAFKDAALKLEVTPTVIREPDATKIKMKLLVENNTPGTVLAGGPALDKQTPQTEGVVREGETLVIGGVTQRTERDNVSKVPLFGDIPIFGWLFKRRTMSTDPDNELVVFVAPTVLKDAPKGAGPTAPPTR